MGKLKFSTLYEEFTVHRLQPNEPIPTCVLSSSFYSITKTNDELSIVCESNLLINKSIKSENWSCIKIEGPLPFELTGILAKIATCLATAEISIFSVSTYDTDYILVKNDNLKKAITALTSSGLILTKAT